MLTYVCVCAGVERNFERQANEKDRRRAADTSKVKKMRLLGVGRKVKDGLAKSRKKYAVAK